MENVVAEQVQEQVVAQPVKRGRGRPVNPDSKRQQTLRAKAEKVAGKIAE